MNRAYGPEARESLEAYLADIHRFPLLTAERERDLARAYRQNGDTRAAHELITANLRFVVKVAYEYRSYGFRQADLVQEGNIGLMRAVQRFDPERGIRLISYAVWWIRAFIHNYILNSYSLVKLGTTQAQRKLFFSLARTRRRLARVSAEHGLEPDVAKIARELKVKPSEVEDMARRLGGRDLSLDAPVRGDGDQPHVELLASEARLQDGELAAAEERTLARAAVVAALSKLDARERYIVEQRLMSDRPLTLAEIGERFGFTRERARHLEARAKKKLKTQLRDLATSLEWPIDDGGDAELEGERAAA